MYVMLSGEMSRLAHQLNYHQALSIIEERMLNYMDFSYGAGSQSLCSYLLQSLGSQGQDCKELEILGKPGRYRTGLWLGLPQW